MLTLNNKVIIYAQDSFGDESAKTAVGFIKYALCETVAIVDRKLANKNASEIVKGLPPVPIYDSIEKAKEAHSSADVLIVGIATTGGEFPLEWLPDMKKAILLRLNIVNGLHDYLSDVKEINKLSQDCGVFIWDVRKVDKKFPVANARLLDYPIKVILTVGTDGAIGKMTVALELTKKARLKGMSAKFIATGQTGMMISGEGVPVDAIRGDFMAGAVEQEIIKASKSNHKIAFVEGQGSILHPGWSGVTLALLHGALPHKLILCHKVKRKFLKNTKIRIESLNQFIKVYESMSLPLRLSKVVGIGLNTDGLNDVECKEEIKNLERETGLPVDDPVRLGCERLINACLK